MLEPPPALVPALLEEAPALLLDVPALPVDVPALPAVLMLPMPLLRDEASLALLPHAFAPAHRHTKANQPRLESVAFMIPNVNASQSPMASFEGGKSRLHRRYVYRS
jgi:hypothetical protein